MRVLQYGGLNNYQYYILWVPSYKYSIMDPQKPHSDYSGPYTKSQSRGSPGPKTYTSIHLQRSSAGWHIDSTWTPKVCRIIAFDRCWAMILPSFGGSGKIIDPKP